MNKKKLIEAIGGLEAIDQPKIVIEFLDNAALTEIETALTTRRHDIVHISGHGSFDATSKREFCIWKMKLKYKEKN